MKDKIITNFKLHYDGVYHITAEKYSFKIYLTFNQIFLLFKKEGIDFNQFDDDAWFLGISFKKAEIIISEDDENCFYTNENMCEYIIDNTIHFLSFIEARIK